RLNMAGDPRLQRASDRLAALEVELRQLLIVRHDPRLLGRGPSMVGQDAVAPDPLALQHLEELPAALVRADHPAEIDPSAERLDVVGQDRKSTRLNSSHEWISYAVFCLKKKKKT